MSPIKKMESVGTGIHHKKEAANAKCSFRKNELKDKQKALSKALGHSGAITLDNSENRSSSSTAARVAPKSIALSQEEAKKQKEAKDAADAEVKKSAKAKATKRAAAA